MASFNNIYANMHNKVEIIGDTQLSQGMRDLYSPNRKTSCVEIVKKKTMIRADAFPVRGKCNVGNLQYKGKNSVVGGNRGTGNVDLPYGTHIDVSWLPFAAGHYHISPDINDYVVATVPIISSDIPNRNMQAVPTKVLFDFSPEYGCQAYRTYVGKPVCKEHNNKDLSLAQGVVIDSFLVPVPKYKIVKVVILCLVDRTKNKEVARNPNARFSWSQGALVSGFQCSCCLGILGPAVRRTCTCYQSNYTDLRSYGGIYNGHLHFLSCLDILLGEASLVSNPADFSAVGETI